MAAASRNKAAAAIVNAQTKPTDNRPAGSALEAVRGFCASKLRSAIRLKAIAAERAPTMATTIQRICDGEGNPLAASTAPRNANGNAKSVCSILIISRVRRVFLITVDTVCQILPQRGTKRTKRILITAPHLCLFYLCALCAFLWHAEPDGFERAGEAFSSLQKW